MATMSPFLYAATVMLALVCLSAVAAAADPDLDRNVSQIIQARGYPHQEHRVLTPDGFILSVQRIVGARYTVGNPNASKPVVILQHGLLDNSFTWVAQEVASQCLGYILADAGYDVWMPNIRGNTYSLHNIYWNPDQDQFWEWSFDEMANIDLPAIFNYVLKTTGVSKLSYVGHSQGTMMGFIAFENPEIAKKVNVFVALAPVAFVHHTTSILLKVLADLNAATILKILGVRNFSPNNDILKLLLPQTCAISPSLCENLMGLVMGWNTTGLNDTRLPVIVGHEPSGTSIQNMLHWTQLVQQNVFQMYDYGSPSENVKHYNTTTPPKYALNKVSVPTALFYGGVDALADLTDVNQIIPALPNMVHANFQPGYAHIDFVWGVDANERIYADVLQLLHKYRV